LSTTSSPLNARQRLVAHRRRRRGARTGRRGRCDVPPACGSVVASERAASIACLICRANCIAPTDGSSRGGAFFEESSQRKLRSPAARIASVR
jgi:hypothetical protein